MPGKLNTQQLHTEATMAAEWLHTSTHIALTAATTGDPNLHYKSTQHSHVLGLQHYKRDQLPDEPMQSNRNTRLPLLLGSGGNTSRATWLNTCACQSPLHYAVPHAHCTTVPYAWRPPLLAIRPPCRQQRKAVSALRACSVTYLPSSSPSAM